MVDTVQPFAVPVRQNKMCRSLISSQSGLFAAGADDGHVVTFDASGSRIATFQTAASREYERTVFPWVCDMAFVEPVPLVLVSNSESRAGLWNARTAQFMSDISIAAQPPHDSFTKVAVSFDGRLAALSGRFGKKAYLWDLQRSELVWQTPSFSSEVAELVFILDTDRIMISTGLSKSEVAILDLRDGRVSSRIANDPQVDVLSCLTHSGQALIALYNQRAGHIKFLDAIARRELSTGHTDGNGGADLCKGVFSKDGSLFAALPDEGPSDIWNVATGERVARLDAGRSYFEQAKFTDDNRGIVAVTAGREHEMESCALWSIVSSRIEKRFKVSEKPSTIVVSKEVFVAGGNAGTVEMFHTN